MRRSALALALVAAWTVVAPAPAHAAEGMEITVGYAGTYQAGRPVLVRVAVEADRLLRGTLELTLEEAGLAMTTTRVQMEVPGGGRKVAHAVLPTRGDASRIEVAAVLRMGDAAALTATGGASVRDDEVVGVLADVAGGSLPETARLAVGDAAARFAAVGDAELAGAPTTLAALDVLAVGPAGLEPMAAGVRDGVLAWIEAGGHLLADVPRGASVPGVPAAYQPGTDGRAMAGMGEVRATAGAMSAGAWDRLVEPTPAEGNSQLEHFGEPIETFLAHDAGIRIPEIGWLAAFLGVYVLVAVPLTMTVLRRRGRGEWSWVAVPGIAVLFTAGAYVAGRDVRDTSTVAHGTVVWTGEAAARADVDLGVVSGSGGSSTITLPAGWVAGASRSFFGPSRAVDTEIVDGRVRVTSRLQVGEFSVRHAAGPVDVAGRLLVTAEAVDHEHVRGTVRNTLDVPLERVAVAVDRSAVEIGVLAAGEERSFDLTVRHDRDPFVGIAQDIWGDATGFRRPSDRGGVVAFPLWLEARQRMPSGFMAPGRAVAAGWTRQIDPPADARSADVAGRALVIGVGPVAATAASPQEAAVRAETVRAPGPNGGFDGTIVVKLALPDSDGGISASGPLVVRAIGNGARYDVWRDDRWEPLDGGREAGHGPFGPFVELDVPEGSVRDGVVWVRGDLGQNMPMPPPMLALVNVVSLRGAA